jgi:excisionase family DNA binding protein
MLLTIKQFANKCGVTTETIRNWEKEGKITSQRTKGGHRRFESDELDKLEINNNLLEISNKNKSDNEKYIYNGSTETIKIIKDKNGNTISIEKNAVADWILNEEYVEK